MHPADTPVLGLVAALILCNSEVILVLHTGFSERRNLLGSFTSSELREARYH